MTEVQSKAAQRRYQREAEAICPLCDGKGRILSESVKTRARQGGHASYRKSLEPGNPTMSERGKRGGAPRMPTLETVDAYPPNKGSSGLEGLSVHRQTSQGEQRW